MITDRHPQAPGESDRQPTAGADDAALPCLADRYQALTNIACEACRRHDLPELERLILARDHVLAQLGSAVVRIRESVGADEPSSIDVLTSRALAFELLEARLVECVRKLRDEVHAALTSNARGQAATTAYHHSGLVSPRAVARIA